MHIISILLLIIIWTLTQANKLPHNEEFNQLVFFEEKIFFLTQTQRYFGFIEKETGYIMMQQEVKEGEQVIRLDSENDFFALRKQRNKVLVFNLKHVNIQQINVQISFRHQKIVDFLKIKEKYYVLTNKDLRKYHLDEEMVEDNKNIMTSCRKNQWFLKLFYQTQGFKIILVKSQEICLRILKQGKKAQQKCLFNISSEPKSIKRVLTGILLQTEDLHYIIQDNLEVFSFRGQIAQVQHNYLIFRNEFKTFDLENNNFTDGFKIKAKNDDLYFHLQENPPQSLVLKQQQNVLAKIQKKKFRRAWIHKKSKSIYNIVFQYESNQLDIREFNLQEIIFKEQL